MWGYVLGTGIAGFTGISAWCVYHLSPVIYDFNSTRQLLKKESLDKFFVKEQEYSKIVSRIGEMARHPEEATPFSIARVLDDLRNSPFYDDTRCKPAYKNLWILQVNKAEGMPMNQLHQPKEVYRWFRMSTWDMQDRELNCVSKKYCTKAELLKELYVNLANDGDNLPLKGVKPEFPPGFPQPNQDTNNVK